MSNTNWMILFWLFYTTLFRSQNRNPYKNFVGFLVGLKTPKGHFEINWPLKDNQCSVIFLYRATTLQPFHRHFSQTKFLNMLDILEDGTLQINAQHETMVKEILLQFKKEKGRLLEISFTTLNDYLWLLKEG